uniref:Uncharacterized protein n=1 Tax=Pleurocladia lacustris TaxID=246121 RepID=A0A1I9LVA6_9PHAE|nr:hypothetical protein [Pleurocladia lacustris]ANS57526.1 hypothetical protein [Pleurocladia lacustris]
MNLYFSPTERNELNFPTSNLSINITDTVINSNDKVEINAEHSFNHIDSNDNIDREEIEINDFYEKYRSTLNKFNNTLTQKKLNKTKVYFIVKSKILQGKEINFAVPIRCSEDLDLSFLELSKSLISMFFFVKVDPKEGQRYIEGRPGNRPYNLKHLVDPEPPFDVEHEFSLEDLILPRKYDVKGDKLDLPEDLELNDPSRLRVERAFDAEGVMRWFSFFLGEYEYTGSMADNTFLINSSNYGINLRYKKNDDGRQEKTNIVSRFKEIDLKKKGFKAFSMYNLMSCILGNTSAVVDKNLIPVFSNLEDAQDLLITTLEEINQPFQVLRKVETPSILEQYRNLDYLDDSFSFQNRYFFPNPDSRIDKIKTRNLKSSSYYHEDNYQTKGPAFVEGTESVEYDVYVPMSQAPPFVPKNVWREEDYWLFLDRYFPGQAEDYSWFESRDMSKSEKVLLKKCQDVKIISMGFADFLEFWNNPTQKNSEILFIPSSKNLKKIKSYKKGNDRLYEYQTKFRDYKNQNLENYTYEIKVSGD